MRTSEGDHSGSRSLDREEGRSRKAATGTRQPLPRMFSLMLSLRALPGVCGRCQGWHRLLLYLGQLLRGSTDSKSGRRGGGGNFCALLAGVD